MSSALLLCLFTGSAPASSASPDVAPARYRFDTWKTENGLPQNTVYSILQTRDGYLWLTTLDGLVRFDGVRFTVFNTANTGGIRSNRFKRMLEDDRGDLWITTEDGGLTRYSEGSFVTYTTADGLPSNYVDGLSEDADGAVIIATGRGLVRWLDNQFRPFTPDALAPAPESGYRGQSSTLWYPEGSALHLLRHGKPEVINLRAGLPSQDVFTVYEDRRGGLWIATRHEGLDYIEGGAARTFTRKDGLPASPILSVMEDREGAVWIGTGDKGLVRFKDGRLKTYTTADGLSDDVVLSLYEDREGNVWAGTLNGGINRLNKEVITTLSTRDGLGADNVYPILEDRAGDVWIGNWPKGLTRYSQGKITYYPGGRGISGVAVTALAEDSRGRIWVGEYGGVSYFENGQFTPFTAELGLSKGSYVSAIYEDREGALWFGSSNGLRRYKDGQARVYTVEDGLAGSDVRAILEDREGAIWAGTYSGLTRIKGGALTSYTKREGLGGDRVRALYEDSDGVLWIGTYDGGLTRLKDGHFTAYTTREGLFNNGAFQILEDGRGNLWMSSNVGIYRVSRRQLEEFAAGKVRAITCTPYGRQDGMLNIECNGGTQPAGVRTRDGKLWFPTQQGVAIIDPASVPLNPEPPPLVIEQVLVDRAPADWRRTAGVFEIGPDRESLEIHYTGLSFIKPEQVTFRYKLEGLDSDWMDAGGRRSAYFSHLPPGDYTFRVMAANSDGVWNEAGVIFRLRVIPPFWRTWWFYSLAAAAVAGLALIAYTRRVSRLERARAAQEAFSRRLISSQESERKRIAAELHDGLGQSLLVIKNRALIALSKPDDAAARAQLEEISSTASHALDEVRGIARNLRPHQLDRLGLTQAIRSIVSNVSDTCPVRFACEVDPIDGLFSPEGEINLYRIVQEGVNNVIKHSGATEALVAIRREGRAVQLVIRDNGRGIEQQAACGGFGLSGITERARILGGKASFQSAPGRGTTISVRLDSQDGRKDGSGNGSQPG